MTRVKDILWIGIARCLSRILWRLAHPYSDEEITRRSEAYYVEKS